MGNGCTDTKLRSGPIAAATEYRKFQILTPSNNPETSQLNRSNFISHPAPGWEGLYGIQRSKPASSTNDKNEGLKTNGRTPILLLRPMYRERSKPSTPSSLLNLTPTCRIGWIYYLIRERYMHSHHSASLNSWDLVAIADRHSRKAHHSRKPASTAAIQSPLRISRRGSGRVHTR